MSKMARGTRGQSIKGPAPFSMLEFASAPRQSKLDNSDKAERVSPLLLPATIITPDSKPHRKYSTSRTSILEQLPCVSSPSKKPRVSSILEDLNSEAIKPQPTL